MAPLLLWIEGHYVRTKAGRECPAAQFRKMEKGARFLIPVLEWLEGLKKTPEPKARGFSETVVVRTSNAC
jgi:hypothetical protein